MNWRNCKAYNILIYDLDNSGGIKAMSTNKDANKRFKYNKSTGTLTINVSGTCAGHCNKTRTNIPLVRYVLDNTAEVVDVELAMQLGKLLAILHKECEFPDATVEITAYSDDKEVRGLGKGKFMLKRISIEKTKELGRNFTLKNGLNINALCDVTMLYFVLHTIFYAEDVHMSKTTLTSKVHCKKDWIDAIYAIQAVMHEYYIKPKVSDWMDKLRTCSLINKKEGF